MRIFKTKGFAKWARKLKLKDCLLVKAVREMEEGLFVVELGDHIFKKRVALNGRGKRGGVRTVVAFKSTEKAFFIFGYAKNAKTNLTSEELEITKVTAKELLDYSDVMLNNLLREKILLEVNDVR